MGFGHHVSSSRREVTGQLDYPCAMVYGDHDDAVYEGGLLSTWQWHGENWWGEGLAEESGF